ncbi:dTMP kinase, partial [Streptomyces sp. NPDC059466]
PTTPDPPTPATPPPPPPKPQTPPPRPPPVVSPPKASGGAVDDTAVLSPVRDRDNRGSRSDSEETAKLPKPPVPEGATERTTVLPPVGGAADETAVLPPVTPRAADETAVLPPVRDRDPDGGTDGDRGRNAAGDPADRVPPGFFRDERSAERRSDDTVDRTRELPQVDASGTPRRRPRPDWAEETPLDDLPTLADELLGPREDEDDEADEGRDGRGGRGGNRR